MATEIEVKQSLGVEFVRVLMTALTTRSLLWAALTGTMGAWGYVLVDPDTLRLLAAAGVTVGCLWPLIWHDRRQR